MGGLRSFEFGDLVVNAQHDVFGMPVDARQVIVAGVADKIGPPGYPFGLCLQVEVVDVDIDKIGGQVHLRNQLFHDFGPVGSKEGLHAFVNWQKARRPARKRADFQTAGGDRIFRLAAVEQQGDVAGFKPVGIPESALTVEIPVKSSLLKNRNTVKVEFLSFFLLPFDLPPRNRSTSMLTL